MDNSSLSKFEEAAVHMANTSIVEFINTGDTSKPQKKVANALKCYLNETVKSGEFVAFIRENELERRAIS